MRLSELQSEKETIESRLAVLSGDVRRSVEATSEEAKKEKNETLNELVREYRTLLERQGYCAVRLAQLDTKVRVLGYGTMTLVEGRAKLGNLERLSEFYDQILCDTEYLKPEEVACNVREVRKLRDSYRAAARKLETAIQGTSWMVEIAPAVPVGDTEEADIQLVEHVASRVNVRSQEDLVQPVDEQVEPEVTTETVEEPAEVAAPAPRKRVPPETPTGEVSKREKKMLKLAFDEANNTPRDISATSTIDGSDYGAYVWAIYRVYSDENRMVEFLRDTGDERFARVDLKREVRDFVSRNFPEENGDVAKRV